MLPSKRPFLADEELGKKDDDHRPEKHPTQQWQPMAWKPPRRRRMLIVPIIIYLLYVFFKNMPTDIPPARARLNSRLPSQHVMHDAPLPPAISQADPPPRDKSDVGNKYDLYYNGELKFYNLGRTLKLFDVSAGRHGKTASKATVFAAASLRIHFILMGRDDVSPEGIQRVNGVDKTNCPVYWHDARVDYAPWSTDSRMEQAIVAVLPYVNKYLRPQVMITHGEGFEEPFCIRGIQKTSELGISHITLPRAGREVYWMATLDSNALRAWNNIQVDILIHAPPNSAGSVIRAIRSLQRADYLGFNPSLTIELSSHVDSELLLFLEDMHWRPNKAGKITIRRQMGSQTMNPKDASLHAVEAFYPQSSEFSHVLLLSPDIELAPTFYHYLMYTLLKYKYSARSIVSPSRLMGISLEFPSSNLISTKPFKRPTLDDTQFSNRNSPGTLPLFLWQAPNSNAALYFGGRWAELHSFLGQRLKSDDSKEQALHNEKVISRRYPAFLEYLLELIRARGYYLLYPAFSDKEKLSLTTFHLDLFQLPEEFDEEFAEDSTEVLQESPERPLSEASNLMSLLDTYSVELPDISLLPILSAHGDELSVNDFDRATEEYRREFKARYGGCPQGTLDDEKSTPELFCS